MTDEHKKRRGRPRTRPGNPKNSYDATQPDAAKEFHEQAFVEHFCQLWKVAAAARAAGYKDRATASKLLRKPSVIAKLREKLKDIEVTSEELKARISQDIRFDIGDLFDIVQGKKEDGKVIGEHVKLNLARAKREGLTRFIKRIVWTKYGPSIDVVDVQHAQDTLAKILKLISNEVPPPPQIESPADLMLRLMREKGGESSDVAP